MSKIILSPLIDIKPKLEFSVGTTFVKLNTVTKNEKYQEYKLVRANWGSEYMMLVRQTDTSFNKAEYGVIPSKLKSGKLVVNINSLKMTLGNELSNWFLKNQIK